MANPRPYVPGFDYSNFEAANPTKPKPGNQLDNDFNNIKATTDDLITGLGNIRRSDGALVNGIVTVDSLADDIADQIIDEVDERVLEAVAEAEASAAASAQSAFESAVSAADSEVAAVLAGDRADLAMDWAVKTDGPVAGGEYSSKYWAQQAAINAGLPLFEAGALPTTDLGTDIYVDNDGVYSWVTSAYVRTDISKSVIALLKTQAAAIFGIGQGWQDVSASRLTGGTIYTNSTSKPILVGIRGVGSGSSISLSLQVDAVTVARPGWPSTFSGGTVADAMLVPPGSTYRVYADGVVSIVWMEYR